MNSEGHPRARMLAGGLLVVVASIGLGFLVVQLARDASIWVLGSHIEAEVVDLWVERTSEEDAQELTFDYYVRYRFTASNGQVVTRSSIMAPLEWSGLGEGSFVDVIYFPLYPPHNRLDDSRFVPALACAYVPLAFICWLGLVGGWHLVRTATVGSEGELLKKVLRSGRTDGDPQ